MRELHGVMAASPYDIPKLKQQAQLLDKFHILGLDRRITNPKNIPEFRPGERAELLFLQERNVIVNAPIQHPRIEFEVDDLKYLLESFKLLPKAGEEVSGAAVLDIAAESKIIFDDFVRQMATIITAEKQVNTIPLFTFEMPGQMKSDRATTINHVLGVTLGLFPQPDESSSWEDILTFRADSHDKRWAFERFLHTLATKKQTEAEIRDDIEWSLNEYAKAMKIHNIKAGVGVVEAYVIPVIEVIEDFAKFNWSKIAKGTLSVKKRKVELMEAEMKAPGRECAYVFDASKRFGQGAP